MKSVASLGTTWVPTYTVNMNYITWARQNKKSLIAKVVTSHAAKPQDMPIAIFMAGIPGAGKTEFIKRLFGPSADAVIIDLDEIVKLFPGYSPDKYYLYRSAGFIILDECVTYCRKKKLNFILDGTFGYTKALENIKHALKRHDVVIMYVWKDPSQAWQHTKDRELIEKRKIDRKGFIHSCANVPDNLKKVRERYGENLPIVAFKRNESNDDYTITRDPREVDKIINIRYTEEELEGLLPQ